MFARTARLLLRPGWIEDAPALARAIGDWRVVRNLARAPWPYDEADAAAFLSRTAEALPSFAIFSRSAGATRLVGGIGLDPGQAGGVELGYWIACADWGRGFASEAGRAVVELAHRGLHIPRLVSGHFADNPASGHVLRKLGFRPTGRSELRRCRARNEEVPCLLYERDARDPIGRPVPNPV